MWPPPDARNSTPPSKNWFLGRRNSARRDRRARTAQTPGGCGALRVGAELIRAAAPAVTVHVSDPTWGNHTPLLGSSGLKLERYPYYDAAAHDLSFGAMLERSTVPPRATWSWFMGVATIPRAPTWIRRSGRRWLNLLQRRRLVPFLDLAYQGIAAGLDSDAAGVAAGRRTGSGGIDRRVVLQESGTVSGARRRVDRDR